MYITNLDRGIKYYARIKSKIRVGYIIEQTARLLVEHLPAVPAACRPGFESDIGIFIIFFKNSITFQFVESISPSVI